ncbi:histidine kinase [Dolosigranulum savutiense]|uniref:Histidine kinase n=1 Tax=Dolosigranulum savutiense TaxID=3110288 RepID=A0AB74TNX3_9LACT
MKFEEKLRKEIFWTFLKIISLLTAALGIIFILFTVVWHYTSFNTRATTAKNEFLSHILQNEQLMHSLADNIAADFLSDNISDRSLYSSYYSLGSNSFNSFMVIINENGQVVFSTSNESIEKSVLPNYLRVVSKYNEFSENEIIYRTTIDLNNEKFLISMRPIFSNSEVKGYVTMITNGKNILNFFSDYDISFVIRDRFNNIFTYNDSLFIDDHNKNKENSKYKQMGIIDGHWYMGVNQTLGDSVEIFLYQKYFNLAFFGITFLIVVVLIFIFFITEGKHLAKKLAGDNVAAINNLVYETKLVKKGYKQYISSPENYEFKILSEHINTMMAEKEKWYKNSIELENQKLATEKMLLDAQFNPHFIYNTLETVRIMCQFDPDLAEKIIISFNKILRYSLKSPQIMPTLEEDLDKIEKYLEIQKIRFEELEYKIDVEQNLLNLSVPKLFLLPLIENSIKYGRVVRQDISIEISISRKLNNIEIMIKDNGPGFDKDIMEIIQEQQNKKELYHGLINTFKKLKLYYGEVQLDNYTNQGNTILVLRWEVNYV